MKIVFEPQKKINDTFLGYYLDTKKELDYPKEKNYENKIKQLINDDSFINEFFIFLRRTLYKIYK